MPLPVIAFSNYHLIRAINRQSGIPIRIVRDVLRHLAFAMREEISRGNPVGLQDLGSFVFRFRKGRRNHYTKEYTPDRLYLHFVTAGKLRQIVQKLDPTGMVPARQHGRVQYLSPERYRRYKLLPKRRYNLTDDDRRTQAAHSQGLGGVQGEQKPCGDLPGDELQRAAQRDQCGPDTQVEVGP